MKIQIGQVYKAKDLKDRFQIVNLYQNLLFIKNVGEYRLPGEPLVVYEKLVFEIAINDGNVILENEKDNIASK